MNFAHLHVHTEYSLLDGSNKIKEYVNRVKELGMTAAAITDHGVVQSFPEANHAIEAIDGAYRKKYQAEHPDATKDELKKALREYRGSILLICHEPEFYQDVVNEVWDMSKWTTKVF